jgi:hypothetical protein
MFRTKFLASTSLTKNMTANSEVVKGKGWVAAIYRAAEKDGVLGKPRVPECTEKGWEHTIRYQGRAEPYCPWMPALACPEALSAV